MSSGIGKSTSGAADGIAEHRPGQAGDSQDAGEHRGDGGADGNGFRWALVRSANSRCPAPTSVGATEFTSPPRQAAPGPYSLHNVDDVLGDLDLDLGRGARLKRWLGPVDPGAYAGVAGRLAARLPA
jgi:hypothetical protein